MHKSAKEYHNLGGYKPWRDKYNYGSRWHVEGKFSAIKRCFGENIRTTKNFLNEAKRKIIDYENIKNYAKNHLNY
jgi:hypothetical protein